MESLPQNPEFGFNPENFHPCMFKIMNKKIITIVCSNYFSSSPLT